jgi:hypothetical protein
MEQDRAVKMMMLTIKYEDCLPEEYHGVVRKYLSLMHVVGFDAGRDNVYAQFSVKRTAVILRDISGTRISQYRSVKEASEATNTPYRTIFHAIKTHKKTRQGYYFEKVY